MYCPDCGRRNEADAQFCSECGTRFAGARARPATSTREPHELVRQASELKDRGQLEVAIELCRRAVLTEPRHRGAHALLGLLYERKGQTASAIREYRVVLEIDPNSTAEREKLDILLHGDRDDTGAAAVPMGGWRAQPWYLPALGAGVVALALIVIGGIALVNRGKRQPTPQPQIALHTQRPSDENTGRTYGTTPGGVRRPTRQPPYPVRPPGSSPFGGARTATTAAAPNLPRATGMGTRPRTGTVRAASSVTSRLPGRLPTYGARVPPIIPDARGAGSSTGRRSVVTPMWEGPLDIRPAPARTETPSGPIEVVGETRADETAPKGYIEIYPSVGVRARMPKPAAPSPSPSAQPTAEATSSGRTHQLAAGQFRQQGRHAEAIREYEAAITAYTQSIKGGLAGTPAAKGIESCKRAIAACRAAQAE